ncbi:MAG: hypothetical protein IIY36_01465, partial [Lachnospiraceae bacterium]|nr:hypothetical protein [Lachnospiraceae bacterium]
MFDTIVLSITVFSHSFRVLSMPQGGLKSVFRSVTLKDREKRAAHAHPKERTEHERSTHLADAARRDHGY